MSAFRSIPEHRLKDEKREIRARRTRCLPDAEDNQPLHLGIPIVRTEVEVQAILIVF